MRPHSPHLLDRVLGWLRAGYPQGVPREDYVALFGVLHRQLTPTEVEQIASELQAAREAGHRPISDDDIRAAIHEGTLEDAGEDDVLRVHARLAAGGWPLVALDDADEDPPAA